MNIQDQIPFKTYFEVDTIAEYHRVIPMETFMKELAPTIWPEGKRIGKFGATVLHLQYRRFTVTRTQTVIFMRVSELLLNFITKARPCVRKTLTAEAPTSSKLVILTNMTACYLCG